MSLSTLILEIQGMHCVSCALNIDSELEDKPGVISAQTSYAAATLTVTYQPDQIQPAEIMATVQALGYQSRLHTGAQK